MGSAARALRPTLQQIEKTSMSIKTIHSRTPYTPLTLLAARRDDQQDAAVQAAAATRPPRRFRLATLHCVQTPVKLPRMESRGSNGCMRSREHVMQCPDYRHTSV